MSQQAFITDENGNITHLEGENGVFYMTEEEKKRREARKEAWIDANRDKWFANGQEFRRTRLGMGVTLADISRLTGFSASKLGAFERGLPIGTREAVEKSYLLALRVRQADGTHALNRLVAVKP